MARIVRLRLCGENDETFFFRGLSLTFSRKKKKTTMECSTRGMMSYQKQHSHEQFNIEKKLSQFFFINKQLFFGYYQRTLECKNGKFRILIFIDWLKNSIE